MKETTEPVRVVLAGAHGHGATYLDRLRRLRGRAELVGVCDVRPVPPEALAGLGEPDQGDDVGALVARTRAEIAVLATPTPAHAPMAVAALEAGAHVLVEKPPAPSMAAFERMARAAERTGRGCQIGFQSLGSEAIAAVRRLVAGGAIGRVTGVGAAGSWPRPAAYFTRSPWAGRRRMGGDDVMDGALTNPFAHAVVTALAVAGAEGRGSVAGVETDLYHANPIEADDTSAVRIRLADGTPVVVAVTLCAPARDEPYVVVHGERGRVRLVYTTDEVTVERPGSPPEVTRHGRADLLENLVAHVRGGEALLVPPARTAAFMEVMEAVRLAPDPAPIGDEHQEVTPGGRVLRGVSALVEEAAERLALFTELDAPWAVPRVALAAAGRPVATYVTAPRLPATHAPRPHLHPVRTLGGVTVTETLPEDHPHHLGAGVAIPDVGGRNFWGGRTYVRDRGPAWLDDHGRQRHAGFTGRTPAGFTETLVWEGPDGLPVIREKRVVRVRDAPPGWALELTFTLANATGTPLPIRSSATKGRPGAAYGGFFWRAPGDSRDRRVFTAGAEGEEAVHGSQAPWLALSAVSAGDEPWTLVFVQDADPWFVRIADYPGIGAALAWDTPLVLGRVLTRAVTVVVADGRLDRAEAARLAAAAAPGRTAPASAR
ncbi:DUF6807 family protein [Bailinhaonella thermotolerans]|uniref:Dehydrogenase n=1 Tax=Bailinhaonella thermotolerans TaxID=1070861 RepID=A0A3A4AZA3_9ACTN|nr:DUF6807 family protein [Bailinhaonella thermotolerans]RJL24702.1 dehydrogenase [Bailinhaonella thermotolerans]